MNYVIIGNSSAAIAAVEAIRERDVEGAITLIAKEKYHTYSRPLISYLLAKKITEDRMYYRPMNFYKKYRVKTIMGKAAVAIDTAEKVVTLDDGKTVSFDKLLIATGGTPFVPDIPGKDAGGVFSFTTWDDKNSIQGFLGKHTVKNAVVLGAGLIGIKATEALVHLGIKITLVELADRVLSLVLDAKGSAIVKKHLTASGVKVQTETTIERIESEHGEVKRVTLTNGESVSCDMVVIAIGVRPNAALAKDTDIKVNKGIRVNASMQTSVEDIYAAGDCIATYDILSGETRPIAILPNAFKQGSAAGANMAGANETYEGSFSMNAVEVLGLPTISVGIINPEDDEDIEIIEKSDKRKNMYKKVVLQADRIIGAVFVKDIDRAGIYTGLIKSGIDVSNFKDKLLEEDFGIVSLPTDYRKHIVTGPGIEV